MIGAADVDAGEARPDNLLRVAERHASTRVPVTSRSERVSALLDRLRGQEYDSASVAAVCDGELLVGVVAIERLLSAPPDAVVDIAAAVGMQTETLAIRGLSVGVGIRRVAVREVVTGGLLGLILGGLAFPLVWAGWRDVHVAAAVALAMLAASAIATCVALLLPWALHRLGKDPAFGSGPIATVIQDLLTVSVYFLTAMAIAS